MYENANKGPNHYQLLNVTRTSPISAIKKSYRALSLELHPDKSKAVDAAEQFNRVKTAFDVLVDKDRRREYNRLGDHGVAMAAQSVIDHKVILVQFIVYYVSSTIFAFMMTFSEPTGDAFQLAMLGLGVVLLVEMVLVLQEATLPGWFLPAVTPHDVVTTLHRIFPAYMNACRCITGAFYQDRKAIYVAAIEMIANVTKDITIRCNSALRLCDAVIQRSGNQETMIEGEDGEMVQAAQEEEGIVEKTLRDIRRQVGLSRDTEVVKERMEARIKLIADPKALVKLTNKETGSRWVMLRDLAIYLIARFVLIKTKA
ncbi:J domain-containing protein [archaeon]|nr:MAG: J domain-containing protein [archaeon]